MPQIRMGPVDVQSNLSAENTRVGQGWANNSWRKDHLSKTM